MIRKRCVDANLLILKTEQNSVGISGGLLWFNEIQAV